MADKPFKAYNTGGLVVNIFAWYYKPVITIGDNYHGK
jgi:hypothetical protein